MDIKGSAELDYTIMGDFATIQNNAFDWLNNKLAQGKLADFDVSLYYTPILMSPQFIDGYPARSRRSVKNRTVFCSPQLDYARYIKGDDQEKIRVVYNGLLDAIPFLKKFGATEEQLDEFKGLIEQAGTG